MTPGQLVYFGPRY